MKPLRAYLQVVGLLPFLTLLVLPLALGGCGRRGTTLLGIPSQPPASAVLDADKPAQPADRDWLARHWTQCLAGTVWDPFAPGTRSPSDPNAGATSSIVLPTLSAIWSQAGVRMAVINGALLSEGSPCPPFRVERIEAHNAILSGPTGCVTLHLLMSPRASQRETSAPAASAKGPSRTPPHSPRNSK